MWVITSATTKLVGILSPSLRLVGIIPICCVHSVLHLRLFSVTCCVYLPLLLFRCWVTEFTCACRLALYLVYIVTLIASFIHTWYGQMHTGSRDLGKLVINREIKPTQTTKALYA